jgi:hypothetical protein
LFGFFFVALEAVGRAEEGVLLLLLDMVAVAVAVLEVLKLLF